MASCEKCGNSWPGKVPQRHGWAAPTGGIVEPAGQDAEGNPVDAEGNPIDPMHVGAQLFTFVACYGASPEQVAAYKAAKRELHERIVARGTEGYGKEQL